MCGTRCPTVKWVVQGLNPLYTVTCDMSHSAICSDLVMLAAAVQLSGCR